jgi:DNA repair exonuclease SbcCD ATPase subunit
LNDLDQLEQELATLRQRVAQSLEIVDDLSQAKQQFAQLSQTHQSLQQTLDEAKTLLAQSPISSSIESRLAQLESQTDIRYEQLQAQLTNFRFDFDAMTRQFQEQLDRSQSKLSYLQRDTEQESQGGDAERLQWLESSLQHLNSTLYADRSTIQNLERRYITLKRMVDIIAVVGFVSIMLMALVIGLFKA